MKKTKVPKIVNLLILTIITIVTWVTFSVIRVFKTSPQPEVAPDILKPLDINFDKTVVDKIEKRIYFEQGQNLVPPTIEKSTVKEIEVSSINQTE